MAALKTAVVILNWNGADFLRQFLPSVIAHSSGAEIWVIDNDSTDSSMEVLEKEFPQVKTVQNETNSGFAAGYNQGLQHIQSDFYVLLNSDVEVSENWLQPLESLMKDNPAVAACQPKVKAYYQKSHFEHAGAAGGFMDKLGYTFCRGRIFELAEEDKGQYDESGEIFWATGACMMIRSETFHEMGGFDADFFAHMEEIDLCWRLKNKGHKIWYCHESTVYHVGGGTLTYESPRKTFLNFRNNLYTITKNYRQGSLLIMIWWRLVLDGIAGVKFLFSGQFSHVWAIVKAHFSYYGKAGKMLKKRRVLKASLNPNNSCIYNGSIVWQAFFKGKKRFSELD